MKLLGILYKNEFFFTKGIHNGIPYLITEENNKFLLNRWNIGFGIGGITTPVGFFPQNEIEPFYYTDCLEKNND